MRWSLNCRLPSILIDRLTAIWSRERDGNGETVGGRLGDQRLIGGGLMYNSPGLSVGASVTQIKGLRVGVLVLEKYNIL